MQDGFAQFVRIREIQSKFGQVFHFSCSFRGAKTHIITLNVWGFKEWIEQDQEKNPGQGKILLQVQRVFMESAQTD